MSYCIIVNGGNVHMGHAHIEMPSNRKRSGGLPDKTFDQKRFLEAFGLTGSIQEAARLANVGWRAHYDWLQGDPTYRQRFREARMWAAQTLEDEAFRRAVHGVRRAVLYKGRQVYLHGQPYYRVEYSDRLLIRLLEAHFPEEYGRRTKQTNLLDSDPHKLTLEQLDVLVEHLLRAALGTDDPAAIAEAKNRLEAAIDGWAG
jgi:hypothetical protein